MVGLIGRAIESGEGRMSDKTVPLAKRPSLYENDDAKDHRSSVLVF